MLRDDNEPPAIEDGALDAMMMEGEELDPDLDFELQSDRDPAEAQFQNNAIDDDLQEYSPSPVRARDVSAEREQPSSAHAEQDHPGPLPLRDPEQEVAAARDMLSSSRFGCFAITPKQPGSKGGGMCGGFEGSCKHHKKNDRTGCKKYISIKGPTQADRDAAFDQILFWCTLAPEHNRQRWHLRAELEPAPARAVLLAKRIDVAPGHVQDDEQPHRAEARRAAVKAAP